MSLTNKYYKLLSGYSESPSLDARALLAYVLQADPLLTWRNLTAAEEEKMLQCIEKRKQGMPIAYITGEKEFMALPFFVNEHTLIPRPDTETIVETIIDENPFESPVITDLCCGSGCIGISLAHYIKAASVTMWDISDGALDIAQKNILRHNLQNRVCVKKGNVLTDAYPKSDIIVSNPPYIADKVADSLEVARFEPHLALKGGEDGLDYYRIIEKNLSLYLLEEGKLILEIGYDEGESIKKLFSNYNTIIKKYYEGNDRVAIISYKKVNNARKTKKN